MRRYIVLQNGDFNIVMTQEQTLITYPKCNSFSFILRFLYICKFVLVFYLLDLLLFFGHLFLRQGNNINLSSRILWKCRYRVL